MKSKDNELKMIGLYEAAMYAGREAALGLDVTPMLIVRADPITGQPIPGAHREVVEGGPCGFAWVTIKGNSAFGKWAKKDGHARSGYPSGLTFWISGYGQSMARKEAHAHAMAEVLRANGVEAYADSRMD